MLRFYEWRFDHDLRLALLPGLICLVACLVSGGLMVLGRAGDVYRPGAVLSAALVFAGGLWATLFAFMLALHPGIPVGYQLGVTLLSVAAALAIAGLGLAVALRRGASMAAGRVSGELHRLGDVVSQSMSASWRGGGLRHGVAAAALLALAICGLDFIAIRGAPPAPDTRPSTPMPNGPMADKPAGVSDQVMREDRPDAFVDDRAGELPARAAARRAFAAAAGTASSAKGIAALVTEIATAQKIDPLLVLAVIATESAFQADAISPGNAQGLMQLMPETARRFGARDLLDPAQNIRAGTRYLRWLLGYFEGDLSLALAAYNAGEGAVLRYGGVPPYPETRAYLEKIRALYPADRHSFE